MRLKVDVGVTGDRGVQVKVRTRFRNLNFKEKLVWDRGKTLILKQNKQQIFLLG